VGGQVEHEQADAVPLEANGRLAVPGEGTTISDA
jgi:hypothetical protein